MKKDNDSLTNSVVSISTSIIITILFLIFGYMMVSIESKQYMDNIQHISNDLQEIKDELHDLINEHDSLEKRISDVGETVNDMMKGSDSSHE